MKLTAYSLMLFFICLNVSLWLVHETQVLPMGYGKEPWESPTSIWDRFSLSIGLLSVGALVAAFTKNPWIGAAAVTLWVTDVFLPIVQWVFFGLPNFITDIANMTEEPGLVLLLGNVITAIAGLVWFWFILGFLGQRYMD